MAIEHYCGTANTPSLTISDQMAVSIVAAGNRRRGNRQRRLRSHPINYRGYDRGRGQRRITLKVYDDLRNVGHGLERGSTTLGTVRAISRSHHRNATEALDFINDALVVGSDN